MSARRGLPIVMLHGIGTDPGVWNDWLPAREGSHAVARPAMRGLDGRTLLSQDAGVLLDAVVADVLAQIPQDGRAHVVGESTGGTVMLLAALRHPERVASVTMVNAPLQGRGSEVTDRWAALFANGSAAWSADMMQARFAPGSLDAAAWQAFEERQRRPDPSAALPLSTMLGGLAVSNAELARAAFVTRQAMHQLLGGLRAAGLVTGSDRGRRERLSLTPAGRRRLGGASRAVAGIENHMLATFTADQRAALHADLRALAENLTQFQPADPVQAVK